MHVKIENISMENIIENPATELFGKMLEFKSNKKILLTGPSGTGKTTFISALYGLTNKYEGRILFSNKSIKKLTRNSWVNIRKNKLSIIFQDLKLFAGLTGYENIIIKNRLTNYKSSKQINSILTTLGIKRIASKQISKMSFGEKQRFSIARAFMQPFSWLILDEPFSHLDKKNRDLACTLIEKECKERDAGIILADHDDDNLFNYDLILNL